MRYVAFLRGINVGGNNSPNMKELKVCFEEQDLRDVATYINSGNIIFSSDESEKNLIKMIEKCIKDRFSLNIPVLVRNENEIAKTVAEIPSHWSNDQAMRTDVLFLWDEVDYPEVLDEIKTNSEVDNLIYTKGAVIWNFDRLNYRKSKMNKFIGTRVYKLMTARNVNTVRKIQEMMQKE